MSQNFEVLSAEWFENLKSIRYTKDWQTELLALLDKDELIEGYPSTDGLLRLTRLVFGEPNIIVNVNKSPQMDDRAATVTVTVRTYNERFGACNHMGAADVSPNNTKHPYNLHPVATAETKALGRALKRLLALRIHTHEEMLGEDSVDYDKIQDQQIRAIENMSKKLNVNLELLLAEECGVTIDAFKVGGSLSKEQGLKVIERLNEMRNKGVPETFQMVTI